MNQITEPLYNPNIFKYDLNRLWATITTILL
jgi:hypothetical protein